MMREQYSTPKQVDVFAKDFLSFAVGRLGVHLSWMPAVKIVYCTSDIWRPIAERMSKQDGGGRT